MSVPIPLFGDSQRPVFLLNSRLGHFSATPLKRLLIPRGPHLSRSYVCRLPSSLTRIHSSAREYSSRLPVSVSSTVPDGLPLGIVSWRLDSTRFASLPLGWSSLLTSAHVLHSAPHRLESFHRNYRSPVGLRLTRHPFGIYHQRYGNMNPFPIDYAFRPRLRGRLTLGRLPLPRKP